MAIVDILEAKMGPLEVVDFLEVMVLLSMANHLEEAMALLKDYGQKPLETHGIHLSI
jgi:hypothetical protein